jgi:predicted transposase YbfD/YdcC
MKNNYIQTLQANQRELARQIRTANLELENFLKFLHSDKFRGTENGERKDWIATADVITWIRETRGILEGLDIPEFKE